MCSMQWNGAEMHTNILGMFYTNSGLWFFYFIVSDKRGLVCYIQYLYHLIINTWVFTLKTIEPTVHQRRCFTISVTSIYMMLP